MIRSRWKHRLLIAFCTVFSTYSLCIFTAPAQVASLDDNTDNEEFGRLTPELLKQLCPDCQSSFVILNTNSRRYLRHNPDLCSKRISPCSTFKILNSLIGLETGVLRDENHTMVWDGTKYSIPAANRDQTLQSAVTNSIVWYFQRVASSIGAERMQEFLRRTQYGNNDISGGITKFWLESTLTISPNEQVIFLERLLKDDLPFSKRSMAIVRGLIRLEQSPKGTLYGKTGSGNEKADFGWFVGYLVQPGKTYVFATTLHREGANGPKARDLTLSILNQSGLL